MVRDMGKIKKKKQNFQNRTSLYDIPSWKRCLEFERIANSNVKEKKKEKNVLENLRLFRSSPRYTRNK